MNPVPCIPTLGTASGGDLGGLIALVRGKEAAFPLTSVRVRTTIAGAVARTEVEQTFHNPHTSALEAVHIFPVSPRAAVTEMELHCGELCVRAECRAREEAERGFEAARRGGHRAALLTAERADVHTLRVTRLPPGESVRVRFVVTEVLSAQDGRHHWRFPTTIAPRYMPGRAVGRRGPGVAADTDRVPDASRISPPLRLSGGTPLDLEVRFVGTPGQLASSLHALRVDLDGGVCVAPNGTNTCDRDFVLSFRWGADEGAARAWTDGEHTLLLLEPPDTVARPMPRDVVFLIDISGSMEGEKLQAAKRALRTALRGLLPHDRLRVIAFDDPVDAHRPDFAPFDDVALARAERFVDGLRARGGTEMLAPIREALAGDRPAGRLRTVLLITDGEAGNEAELAAAVANRREGARFFTLGIDTAVNAALLEQLARVGGGACTLCTPADDIEAVVANIEARFGYPIADEVRVEGEAARPEGFTLFAGQPVPVLLRGAPTEVVATGRGIGASERWAVAPARAPFSLAAPWARERVQWLEDRLALRPFEEEAIAPEIRRVALAAGIASRFTAFVAVERTRVVGGEVTEVVQPVELPAMWVAEPVGAAYGGGAGPVPCAPPPGAMDDAADECEAEMVAPKPSLRQSLARAAPLPMRDAAPFRGLVDARTGFFPGGAPVGARDDGAAAPPSDPITDLVQRQAANGSWGDDPLRTAAALLALLRAGHTRRAGLRKRAVQKAAAWLAQHADVREVAEVLAQLDAVEAGGAYTHAPAARLRAAGPEGALLA
jgi:Ca-activated chloride channel family protein